ncbi:hypothetical protein OAA78_04270, partial [Flavobacteriaceae bacterium]|nr:hypothetical protein [Flavobacteriaceae bacterium]
MKNILYPFLLLGILFSCADDKKTEETIYKLDNRHNEFPIEIEEIIIKEKNILRIMINKKEQVLIENDYSRIYYITDKVIEFIDNGGGYDLDECDYCNGAADPRSSDNPIKAIVALSIDNIEEHRYLYFKSLIEDGYNYLRNKVSLKKYNQSYDSMVSNYYDRYWQGDRSLLRDKIYLIRSLYPINLTSELAPPPPEVIEIVEDEEEIEETVIE